MQHDHWGSSNKTDSLIESIGLDAGQKKRPARLPSRGVVATPAEGDADYWICVTVTE